MEAAALQGSSGQKRRGGGGLKGSDQRGAASPRVSGSKKKVWL
jgi:hypothetical protein